MKNDLLDFHLFHNPKGLGYSPGEWSRRTHAVDKWSWAIPNDQALVEIASHGPVLEIGSGLGYWAGLLSANHGVDIIATDLEGNDPGPFGVPIPIPESAE